MRTLWLVLSRFLPLIAACPCAVVHEAMARMLTLPGVHGRSLPERRAPHVLVGLGETSFGDGAELVPDDAGGVPRDAVHAHEDRVDRSIAERTRDVGDASTVDAEVLQPVADGAAHDEPLDQSKQCTHALSPSPGSPTTSSISRSRFPDLPARASRSSPANSAS